MTGSDPGAPDYLHAHKKNQIVLYRMCVLDRNKAFKKAP